MEIKKINSKLDQLHNRIERYKSIISNCEKEMKKHKNELKEKKLDFTSENSQEQDLDFIRKIKSNNCEKSFNFLTEKHQKLCYKVVNRYARILPYTSGVSQSDLLSDIPLVVYNSVKKYDPTMKKAKFSTYLANQMKFHCMNTINYESKSNLPLYHSEEEKSLDFIIEKYGKQEDSLSFKGFGTEDAYYLIDILKQIKDQRVVKIFELRYFSSDKKERTWKEVGKKIGGLSGQSVKNIHDKYLNFLKNRLDSKLDLV